MSIQVIEGQTYNFSFGYFKGEAITWTLNYSFSYGSASPDDITYTPIQATFSGGNTPISFSITQDTKAEGTETAFLKLSGLYWSNEFPQNKYSYSYDQEISIKDDDIVCNVDFNGDGTIETFEGSAAQLSHKLQGIRIRLDGISDQTSYLNEALDGLNSANIYRNIEFVAKITSSLASITADVLTLGGASEARAGLALAKDLIDAANNSADFFKSINDQGKDVYDKIFGTLSFSLQSTKLFADQYSKFFHILPVAGDVLSGGAEINSYLNDLRAISADVKGIKTKIDDLSEKKINLEQALDTVYQCLDEASSSAKLSLSSAKFAQASIISEKTIFADSSLAAFKVGADINVISNGDSVFVSGSVFGDHLKAEDLGSYKQSLIMLSDGDDTYTTSQSVDKFETILGGNGYDIVHTDLKSSEIVHLANNEWIVFNNDQAKLHIEGVEELYVNGKSLILSGIDAIEAISSQVSTSNDVKIGIFNDTNPDDGIVFSRTVSGANSEFMYFKGNELYLKAAAKLPLDSELTEVNISVQGSDGTNYQEKFNAQIKPSDTAAFKSLTDMSDNVSYNTEKSAVFILALSGNDSITGSKFDDILNGGEGNDLLRGGAGNDIIIGGSGYDRMMGGSGNDTFVFSKGDLVDPLKTSGQMDHIIDFHAAGDNSSVEKDNLKFTGFGDGKLIFDHNLGNNPYTQIYKLISEDGNYQGSILVQMADTTKQLSSSDYMFA